jgi:hypothetical protein
MSGLSLWNIEQGLADLFEQREQALQELGAPELSDLLMPELERLDLAIAAYMKAEVQKVDGVRGWWKYLEMMRDAAKDEARTMQDRAQAFDRQLTVLKSAILVTLEEMQFRAGKPRKLEGKTGSISLVGNGGRQPVVITDEALIPDEYRTVTVKMNAELWRKVCASLPDLAGLQECRKEPNLTAIYNGLQEPCGGCGGTGKSGDFGYCIGCGGAGKQGVPGAILAPLGSHVRVK